FVLVISLISALYGVIYAIGQHDLKKLLAYHSIENIGIIGLGIGVGMIGLTFANYPVAILGFAGAILHVLNHSIFKELLFLAAGSVYTQTHTKDIEILGGLIKSMPKTAVLFLIASIAICGLPPFNGFISEFLIYLGFLKSLLINNVSVFLTVLIAIAGLGLVGTMAILCFTKAFSIIFLGEARTEAAKNVTNDTSDIFIIPMSILAVFIVIIGLLPQFIFRMLYYPISSFGVSFNKIAEFTYITDIMQKVSFISSSMLITIIIAIFIKKIIYKNQIKHTTWGCGYNRLNPKMQYSASSYAEPFLGSLKPLFKKIADIKKPKNLFPKEAHYETHIEDIEEEYFIKPFVHFNEDFLAKFEKLQNGDLQQYLKFGLIFLVLALIGVFTI
ncbi:MAG: proton-conducting transporter membrane subunit, partial [Candidatus Gastranaerophilaceae bacterium]